MNLGAGGGEVVHMAMETRDEKGAPILSRTRFGLSWLRVQTLIVWTKNRGGDDRSRTFLGLDRQRGMDRRC